MPDAIQGIFLKWGELPLQNQGVEQHAVRVLRTIKKGSGHVLSWAISKVATVFATC